MKLKRLLAGLLVMSMSISMLAGCGKSDNDSVESTKETVEGESVGETLGEQAQDVTLNFWYTDAAMTDYFNYAVERYQADHPNVTISMNMAAATGYLENINTQSIKQTNAVDVYMLHNSDLEQAYLAGLANVYDPADTMFNEENFGRSAIRAVTYGGKQVAYPLYFDSAFLVYNKAYVTDVPKTFDDIKNFLSGEGEEEEGQENTSDEKEDILSKVEKTFVWPVSDYTFNYVFLSDGFVVGGANGDDRTQVDIANDTVRAALDYYHGLYDFYAIDRKEVDYESCINDFIEGKTAFTFAKTAMLKKLNESEMEYGAACMPDITESIKASSLSYTQTLVINPYSLNIDVAKDFVKSVTCDYIGNFYNMTGFYPSCKVWEYNSDIVAGIYDNYNDSTPRPKLMTLGDYYIELEILLHKIWDDDGEAEVLLNEFKDFVTMQISY